LIVPAGFVDFGYGTAMKSNNNLLAKPFHEMAKQNLETVLGVPIDKIHFTDAGLAVD